jgi:ATP-dependent DNA helicase RecG
MNAQNKQLELMDRIIIAVGVGEDVDWEFKSAKGGIPGSLWETYSAMANTEGGVIVLGVRESDSGAVIDGLTREQVMRYQSDLWSALNNRSKVNINLLQNADVDLHELPEGIVLSLVVPRATRHQRPVFLNNQPMGNTYRRNHDGDYRCSDNEVRRMFADAQEAPADYRILPGFNLTDLDPASLSQYRQRFRAAKGDHPWLGLEDKDLLEKLQGWRRDRATGEEGLTLAGLLMFGRGDALRDPTAAPAFFVDYREKLDPTTRWTDRIYPDGTWEANIFQFYQRVWPKLASGLPTPFQLEKGMRKDDTPAHEALREAFVNALIHADYAAPGGVVITRLPDSFMMENPGTLLVSMEQFRRGGVSECRNKALQQMFLMMGGGERAGSGVDKIRSGWKSRHWRTPLIKTRPNPDRVILSLPMVSLIPDETMTHLESYFGREVVQSLAPDELQAMATAQIEGSVANGRLQELLDQHPSDITRILKQLCTKGLLESDNRRRWATYRLAGPVSEPPSNSLHLGGSSLQFGPNSLQTDRNSPQTGDSLPKSESVITAEGDGPRSMDLAGIREIIGKRKHLPKRETEQIILQLCAKDFFKAQDLAKLLNRSQVGLQNRFLTPMVQQKLLHMKYPEVINHPHQAYRAVALETDSSTETPS